MADLFDQSEAREPARPRVFSISEVTKGLRGVIEGAFGEMWVEGEVSNYRKQASGHQYFTLKDAAAQLSCVWFFRGWASRSALPLRDGMQVQARGRLSVYEARGQYQLNVVEVLPAGAGLLQAKFEALKRRLAEEGLFDAERKRALPKFPRAVAIVTSPTGAALRDMLNILARRAPWLRVVVSPARVQGAGAAGEIIAALELAQSVPEVDAVVLARGGGSMEDLWEFNDEALARAIVATRVPVVSAVGHEIDFTIADFAADLRAPTPSAAAELIAPDTVELQRQIEVRRAFLKRTAMNALATARAHLAGLARDGLFREPHRRAEQCAQRIDLAQQALARAAQSAVEENRRRLAALEARLLRHRPDQILALRRQQLAGLATQLRERLSRRLRSGAEQVSALSTRLRLLSPRNTLERGYSITTDAAGHVLRSAADAAVGAEIVTELRDGKIASVVRAQVS